MPYQTSTTRRGASHGLHLVLTVLTCGMWAITGWPIAAIMGRRTKQKVWVPEAPPAGQPYHYGPPQHPGGAGPHGPQPPRQ